MLSIDELEIIKNYKSISNSYNVYSMIDPYNSYSWLYKCDCNKLENINSNKIWINEYKCIKLDNTICDHIKKCYIAKTIIRYNKLNKTIPNVYKNLFGKNFLSKAYAIYNELNPMSLDNYVQTSNGYYNKNGLKFGMGRVKIYDYTYYNVKLYYPNNWLCNCYDFKIYNKCFHIYKSKLEEKYLQKNRIIGIMLAFKYLNENNSN
tara:strand:+ start:2882 stop:3496 length:615 start_codon:yes stop_codon:yes gene_type:complete